MEDGNEGRLGKGFFKKENTKRKNSKKRKEKKTVMIKEKTRENEKKLKGGEKGIGKGEEERSNTR